MDNIESDIVRMLKSECITPKGAAFLMHAIMEMATWNYDEEVQKEFKKHVLKLFDYDN